MDLLRDAPKRALNACHESSGVQRELEEQRQMVLLRDTPKRVLNGCDENPDFQKELEAYYKKTEIPQETMLDVIKNGVHYDPAGKHYSRDTGDVICDRCLQSVMVAVGWEKYDLCLSCVK